MRPTRYGSARMAVGRMCMRLRLWHRIFALTALATLAAVVIMLGVQQQGLRRGFLEYLNALEAQRAQGLSTRLEDEYVAAGGWERLRRNPQRFRHLIEMDQADSTAGTETERPPRPAQAFRDPARAPRPGAQPEFRPRAPMSAALPPRFAVYDADGEPVIGPPVPWADAQRLDLRVEGLPVGQLLLRPLPRLEESGQVDFVSAQLDTALLAAAAVLVGALLASMLFARRLVLPLRRMAERTRHMAAGDYSTRLDLRRDDEIGDLAADIDAMARSLDENRRARQRWTAEISHELRTPLSVMRAQIEAVEDGIRAFDADALAALSAETGRMGRLVEDLYQLSLADAGALDYHFEALDLAALIREVAGEQADALSSAGLQLDLTLAGPALLRCDAARMRQLLRNLFSNTCRYTQAGGRVRITLEHAGPGWRLRFEDSAPGVPDTALAHLFDPLYRVEHSRSRAVAGAGLGLAIVDRIARAHGAGITAAHSPLGGLCIELSWP